MTARTSPPRGPCVVAVVGGGAAGVLCAIHLLRSATPVHVVLIERGEQVGAGMAYGTTDPVHLLNVRASGMSAFDDDPLHFARWAIAEGWARDRHAFVPRAAYRRYLQGVLDRAARRTAGSLQIVGGTARAVIAGRPAAVVTSGNSVVADHVVVATGYGPPADVLQPECGGAHVAAAWSRHWLDATTSLDDVLLIGSGLTAVDMCLSLHARQHRGRVHMVSRHGWLPTVHAPAVVPVSDLPTVREQVTAPTARALLHALRSVLARAEADGATWQSVIDGLRPDSADLWRALPQHEKVRFSDHLAPRWDVARHRMAPEAAQVLDRLRGQGRLVVHRGTVRGIARCGDQLHVTLAGRRGVEQLEVATAVNCTAPSLRAEDDPFLAQLVEAGLAAADPMGLGITVTRSGNVAGTDGVAIRWLWAVGPLRKGSEWEATAVPELRRQAQAVSRSITGEASSGLPGQGMVA